MRAVLVLILYLSHLICTKKLIGYDCNLSNGASYTEFSMLEVGKCRNLTRFFHSKPQESWAQVIRRKNNGNILVTHCEVRLSWSVAYCGSNFYTRVWNQIDLVSDEMSNIGKDECTKAYTEKSITLDNRRYEYGANSDFLTIKLDPDGTSRGWLYIQGSEHGQENTCTYSSFIFRGKNYKSHILKMKFDIVVERYNAEINYEQKILKLNEKLGTQNLKDGYVFDSKYGLFTFNHILAGEISNQEEYEEIIRGKSKLFLPVNNQTQTMLELMPQACATCPGSGSKIAVLLRGSTKVCIGDAGCKAAYSTHITGVYIIITGRKWTEGPSFFKMDPLSPNKEDKIIDLRSIMGNIFITSEIKLETSFIEVAQHLCEQSRRAIMSNMKSNAKLAVGDNSHIGKTTLQRGSIIYAIQCLKVVVQLRTSKNATTTCYEDIPVKYVNAFLNRTEESFLNAVTHELQPKSKRTECSAMFPLKIGVINEFGSLEYICFTPDLLPSCGIPEVLKPLSIKSLYEPSLSHIDTGLYTKEQLLRIGSMQFEKLRTKVFSSELSALSADGHIKNDARSVIEGILNGSADTIRSLILPNFLQGILFIYDQIYAFIFFGLSISIMSRIFQAVLEAKRSLTSDGVTTGIMVNLLINVVKSFLFTGKKCKCRCRNRDFMEEITNKVRERDRLLFLKEIYEDN